MTTLHPLNPTALVAAEDLIDQLRVVVCPPIRSLERVVAEHDSLVDRWPRAYRVPCPRPPPDLRVRIEPEGLLELLNQAHTAWREVCSTRATAWQLALLLVAARLEVERLIARRRRRMSSRAPPPPSGGHARGPG